MSKIGEMTLKGVSGKTYIFQVYSRSTEFKALGAVYVMSKRTQKSGESGGTHDFLYIGQTGDLSNRPLNHHKKSCFDRRGADHVSVHIISDEKQRLNTETDLIRAYSLPCNG
ncbi:MAG: GIY-YIG nuclease family protein [Rhodospirillales bacterium]|nr:GIY-YIG nuclease family protein [Rhodospirillales bacterium]